MSTVHIISSSDGSEEELDLFSRLNKKYGHQFGPKSEGKECSTKDFSKKIHLDDDSFTQTSDDQDMMDLSGDELPDIESASLMLSIQNQSGHPTSSSPTLIPNIITNDTASIGSSPSVNFSLRERKKKEREAKKEEGARIKKKKQDERMVKKATKPGECHKHMLVKIDRKLLELAEGSEIISKLLSMDVRFEATEQVVPNAVTFYRRDPLTGREQNEKESVVIIALEDFLLQVYNQIYGESTIGSSPTNTLCDNCFQWKTLTDGSNLTLVVCGLDNYYKKAKCKTLKEFREDVLSESGNIVRGKTRIRKKKDDDLLTRVSRIDIETALVTAQIERNINVRLVANPSKVADFIGQVTKAIAERPHKIYINRLNKEWNNFSSYIEGSNSNCIKIDKSGVGLLKLWIQQLRHFSNVGIETAQAIAKEYPSPQSLIQAYRTLPSRDAMKLLADIPVRRGVGVLANTRKVGIKLSKMIYKFFTETDAAVCL